MKVLSTERHYEHNGNTFLAQESTRAEHETTVKVFVNPDKYSEKRGYFLPIITFTGWPGWKAVEEAIRNYVEEKE